MGGVNEGKGGNVGGEWPMGKNRFCLVYEAVFRVKLETSRTDGNSRLPSTLASHAPWPISSSFITQSEVRTAQTV
jgi:hypothetical protein